MNELRFDGRVVIVTGGGRGIGRSHALLFAARGASVVVADVGATIAGTGSSTTPAEEVAGEIEAHGGAAVACPASVAEEDGARTIVDTAIERFGRLDVVVNNAGISDKHRFAELTHAQFERMIAVHFYGTLNMTQAAWPHFVDAGYGRFVNTASEGMLGAQDQLTSYAAGKGAVWAFTRNLAAEGVPLGIRANMVAPRANTRMAEDGAKAAARGGEVPPEVLAIMERMKPDLVSPAAVYLAHESCELNGEVLIAGGGQVMRLCPTVTTGITRESLTVEDVAGNIDAILDTTGARVAPVGSFLT
jgi:NAD(P)-dependent dehydrogenase (short-subunit alcohol dehydrogenase family)